jgi:transcriptional regulator with XRE-family HTH domain
MTFDRQDFYREVGLRMQLWRKRAPWTQEQLAEAIGEPRANVGNWERGRCRIPADALWRIAAALKIAPSVLLPERSKDSTPASIPFISGNGAAVIGVDFASV